MIFNGNWIQQVGFLGVLVLLISSCDQADDECQPPMPTSAGSVAADTLCLGLWEWQVTYELHRITFPNAGDWMVVDTIYPGEPVTGFETINYCSVNIDEEAIRINQDGQINEGCYSEWESFVLTLGSPVPSSSFVLSFYEWEASLGWNGRFSWRADLIGDNAFDNPLSALPYITYQPGTPNYEEDTASDS